MKKTFVSNIERRLVLMLMILITCTYYLTLENRAVENYNRRVKAEQEYQLERANKPQPETSSPSFGIYCFEGRSLWLLLYEFQFFYNPFLCFLLRKASLKKYLVSLFFTGATFLFFIIWLMTTSHAYHSAENYSISETSFNEVLLLESTKYDLLLFIIVGIFVVLQSFIMLRFVLEKFQAKISLE